MCYSRWPATSWVHYTTRYNTQSSAPEDGQNNCPKYVELTVIINKLLLLYPVGCLYYLFFILFYFIFLEICQTISIYSSTECRVFYNVKFCFVKFTFYINDVLLFKCPFPGPKG